MVGGSNPPAGAFIMKRIILVHGWSGSPEADLFLWFKDELEKKGFKVECPSMPNADKPEIKAWVSELSKVVGKPDDNTFFIGHSIGCQTIMRYLETLKGTKVGGAVFVAGWFNLENLETDEERLIAKPWIETQIDTEKIKKACNKFIAIFSDNDPFVPLTDSKLFKNKLGAKIVIEKNKGHFTSEDGVTTLPIALNAVLELAVEC